MSQIGGHVLCLDELQSFTWIYHPPSILQPSGYLLLTSAGNYNYQPPSNSALTCTKQRRDRDGCCGMENYSDRLLLDNLFDLMNTVWCGPTPSETDEETQSDFCKSPSRPSVIISWCLLPAFHLEGLNVRSKQWPAAGWRCLQGFLLQQTWRTSVVGLCVWGNRYVSVTVVKKICTP